MERCEVSGQFQNLKFAHCREKFVRLLGAVVKVDLRGGEEEAEKGKNEENKPKTNQESVDHKIEDAKAKLKKKQGV